MVNFWLQNNSSKSLNILSLPRYPRNKLRVSRNGIAPTTRSQELNTVKHSDQTNFLLEPTYLNICDELDFEILGPGVSAFSIVKEKAISPPCRER